VQEHPCLAVDPQDSFKLSV